VLLLRWRHALHRRIAQREASRHRGYSMPWRPGEFAQCGVAGRAAHKNMLLTAGDSCNSWGLALGRWGILVSTKKCDGSCASSSRNHPVTRKDRRAANQARSRFSSGLVRKRAQEGGGPGVGVPTNVGAQRRGTGQGDRRL
jgi:hypothetical protein